MMYDNATLDMQPVGIKENNINIKVIGVGGCGCNAVTRLHKEGIENVELMVCNTDRQALYTSSVPEKLQLGANLTKGLGAGCDPEKGRNAALESVEDIKKMIGSNIELIFITAGMGGGTGTGASPVIAKIAKEMGILTIAVVTYPSKDESYPTLMRAYKGIEELNKYIDAILIIDNQKIYDIYGNLTIFEAFQKADDVLITSVKGISEIVTKVGFINIDLQDVANVMRKGGMSIMGIGVGNGKNRARDAVERALTSPLLKDFDMKTARNILINIYVAKDKSATMDEMSEMINYVMEATGQSPEKYKRGIVFDDNIKDDSIRITFLASGFRMSLVPPIATTTYSQDENAIILINDQEDEDGIRLPIDGGSTPEIGITSINLEDIPIFTAGDNISDFENETAFDRKIRIKKERQEHSEENNL